MYDPELSGVPVTALPAKVETPALPAGEVGSVALMRLIERAAMSSEFDVEKLDKLLAVKERWEANEARKAFVAAKAGFKGETIRLTKNKTVRYATGKGDTEYDHATLDHVANAVGPALAKHGLTYSWKTEQGDGGVIRVTCILTHTLGHSESVTLSGSPDQSGGKNSIQAVGSTVTYLERYTLLSILGMAAADQDDDARTAGAGGPISAEQKTELIEMMKSTGADTARFLRFFKVETLDELPASQFEHAKAMLVAKKRKAA
ncbi:MAG: ERF family protein [Planctomycetes bacterium]|nr:ERF family protein [Planctomycetota bacterium]